MHVDAATHTRSWVPPWPLNVGATLGIHRHGGGDPSFRTAPDGAIWRSSATPDGAGTVRISWEAGAVNGRAWGDGAEWLLDRLPALLGADDEPNALVPRDDVVRELVRRAHGIRIGRSDRVFEALVPAVLEQKVVTAEAFRAWRYLLRRHGSPAPGPVPPGLMTPPDQRGWSAVDSWEWHLAGAEPVRMRTIIAAAGLDVESTPERIRMVRGIGVWTEAEVRIRALGDPDAVSVGDYHVPGLVGFALVGEKVDDARMLELLEPYRGQRGRVARLIQMYGPKPQRRGHRMSVRDYRAF